MTPHHEPARDPRRRPDEPELNRENGFAAAGGNHSSGSNAFESSSQPSRPETDRATRSALMDCYNG